MEKCAWPVQSIVGAESEAGVAKKDKLPNSLFRRPGGKFDQVTFDAGLALEENGLYIFGDRVVSAAESGSAACRKMGLILEAISKLE